MKLLIVGLCLNALITANIFADDTPTLAQSPVSLTAKAVIGLQTAQPDPPSRHKTSASHAVCMKTDYINANISLDYPGFEELSVDSLGEEHFTPITMQPPARPWQPTTAVQRGSCVEYRRPGADRSKLPRWAVDIGPKEITLESHWSANDPPEPLVFSARNNVCHITMLGLMETNGTIQLPAILYFPDQGAFRVSSVSGGFNSVGYETIEPPQYHRPNIVQITFPGATKENPRVKYSWEITAIHPAIGGIDLTPRFDGFRRDWLNILQINPRTQALANNACSTTCAFCYYEYADIAAQTPPLAHGLSALDMVRQTLDRILSGGNAYGLSSGTDFQEYASDTLPSLLIAAEDYANGGHDQEWLGRNYTQIRSWADDMLATAKGGDGLIQYWLSGDSGSWPEKPKYHPSNWWDTIGFGHEDAYANALAYRALRGMEQLAQQVGRPDDQAHYHAAADKLKAAYFNAFYDPATGVLAGWRSADGQLHDYYFLWVNGIAIHYGLVPKDKANEIMDRLLAKMNEVGYTNFALGLPGNLIPVARKDYVDLRLRVGGGIKADNSDGFEIYENGGATGCFSYFTVAALYDLGRIQDGDRILFPLLQSIANGGFEGWSSNGRTRDWKSWDGTGHGYEGFLSDNYYVLLAVMDRKAALEAYTKQFRSARKSAP
jgi:Bacterial alpha-L-rhamnosidase 6 hairpin glycosidase domain